MKNKKKKGVAFLYWDSKSFLGFLLFIYVYVNLLGSIGSLCHGTGMDVSEKNMDKRELKKEKGKEREKRKNITAFGFYL